MHAPFALNGALRHFGGSCSRFAVAVAVGCSSAPLAEAPIGMSEAVPEASPSAPTPPVRGQGSGFAAAMAWPEAAPPMRALAHFRDGTLIHVRIDPAVPQALAAYRALSVEAPMPEGSRVMAWHLAPAGKLLGGYLLEKRGGAWSALEVDAQGTIIDDRESDRLRCVRCHDMAPSDHLFGSQSASVDRESTSSAPR